MNWFKKAEAKYKEFILSKIPKKLLRSQLFFFALMLLAIPITVLFSQQLQQNTALRIAGGEATPVNPPPPIGSTRVFITTDAYKGNMGGVTGADIICSTAAAYAGLGNNWRAWLSSNTVSASTHLFHSTGPYTLINGTVIANNWNDLTDGTLAAPINISETGYVFTTTNITAWTGTASNGSIWSANDHSTCINWTYDDQPITGYDGVVGNSSKTNTLWTGFSTAHCSTLNHLYCVEQVFPSTITPILTPTSTPTFTPTPTPTNTPIPTPTNTPIPTPTLTPQQKAVKLQNNVMTNASSTLAPKLNTYLKSVIAYLGFNTPTMKSAACQQLTLFKSAVTSAQTSNQVSAPLATGWRNDADNIRSNIPCIAPN